MPSPITHSVTASGSPVAIDSTPFVKMENRDAMVLGTGSSVPSTVTGVNRESINSINQGPSHHLQSSAMVTSAHPVTTMSGALTLTSEQSKLHALLQSAGTPAKTRNKTPTVRELLPPNSITPQTLQQTIIIKPPPQIVHHVNQPGTVVEQGALVNHHQAIQAVQALQDGQKYLVQSFPVLTQPPASAAAPVSCVEPYPPCTMVATQMPQHVGPPRPQDITPNKADIMPAPVPVPAPAFTEPEACQSNSPPMDIDPLTVLSATAAKKQPLPVPNTDNAEQSRPPPSHLHVIQPASAHHEMVDTTRSAEENTPVQVEEEDWDPFVDLKQQCNKKLKYLEQKRYVDSTSTARLNIIKGMTFITVCLSLVFHLFTSSGKEFAITCT